MGDEWSVLILMWIEIAAIMSAIHKEPRLRGFTLLNLLHQVMCNTVIHARDGVLYYHVDDLIIGHEHADMVRSVMRVAATALRFIGFIILPWHLHRHRNERRIVDNQI